MKKLLALIFAALITLPSFGASVTKNFTTTTTEFPNPERGWYRGGSNVSPYFYINDFDSGTLGNAYSAGSRTVIGVLYLGDYVTTATIPGAFITAMNAKFALLRSLGLKVILRPAYNYSSGGAEASQAIMVGTTQNPGHIGQLSGLFHANADVIAYIQGGFIGYWGEWHSTACANSSTCRTAVFTALLAAKHPRTFLQIRYPKYVIQRYATALSAAQAYTGSAQSMVSAHNDCFMSDNTDVGTFSSSNLSVVTNTERAYTAAITQFAPYGGETCSGFSPTRMACSDILSEGPAYHLTYLNRNFYTAFHNSWTSGGCFAQVERSIGYRIQIDQVRTVDTVTHGNPLAVQVDLRNIGWSRHHQARRVTMTLKHTGGAEIVCSSAADLRVLPPTATASTTFPISCPIPAGATTGSYALMLSADDVWPTTAGNAKYSVRWANADNSGAGQAWDATNGWFDSGVDVTVN
jgi:hypothetical protein